MAKVYVGNTSYKIHIGTVKIKKGYIGSQIVYSAGNTVTYAVDTGITYKEDVDSDSSCLSPKTFTPQKSGWIFVGWREDKTASPTVLTSKIMKDDPITLYAVFKQNVVLTKYNNTTAVTETKQKYYNNANITNPSFTLSQSAISGWTPLGWCTSASATGSVVVANGGSVALSSNATYYGKYSQTITLTCIYNKGTRTTKTGTRYLNKGTYSNPSFTIANPTVSGATFKGWSKSTAATVAYTSISNLALSANMTLYGILQYGNANITIRSASSSGGWPYMDVVIASGVDGTKYQTLTGTVNASGHQNYESSYYYFRMDLYACGNKIYLGSTDGSDTDIQIKNANMSFPLGTSSNEIRIVSSGEHSGTGHSAFRMEDAKLIGRTIVG